MAKFALIGLSLLALVTGGAGFFGLGVAGVCDTSCPSDTAVVVYRLMFNGGFAVFIACVVFWFWRRNHRR